MSPVTLAGLLALPFLVSIYTVYFGRWLARRGYGWGALGVYLLALLTLALPGWMPPSR